MVTLNTEDVRGCTADAGLICHKDDLVSNVIKETLVFPVTIFSLKKIECSKYRFTTSSDDCRLPLPIGFLSYQRSPFIRPLTRAGEERRRSGG